jgi:hypothetical protein
MAQPNAPQLLGGALNATYISIIKYESHNIHVPGLPHPQSLSL